MDPIQILARLEEGHVNPPTDAELTVAAAALTDALDAATTDETPDKALAVELRKGLDAVQAKIAERQAEAEATRAEVRALREGIFDDKTEDPEDPAAEPEETPAEPEAVADPVAASAEFNSLVNSLRSRTAAAKATEAPRIFSGATLKPIGAAASFELPADAGFRELGAMFSLHGRGKGRGTATLAQLTRVYPEGRTLGENSQLNGRILADALGTGATTMAPIAASGGICGPGDVDHSHPICSERGRVVTTGLPQFNASRGTITYPPSVSLGDVDDGVSVWTAATDANPGVTTKPCPPVDCAEELTASVDAVVKCLTVGNFQAKFSPEFWAARLEVLAAAHDREGEQKALTEIYTLSSDIGTVNEGSTLWNFIQMVRNVISADRSARRNWSGGYTVIADAYGRDQILNQLAANLGSGADIRQSLIEAGSILDGAIADAGVTNMIWTYDGTYNGSAHRIIGNHSQSGHLPPTNFGVHIFPEETFLFLDGGTLDLGTEITDSTLNATNDRQAFAETFEKVVLRGCSAFRGVVTIDASCGCGLTSI